MTGRPPGGFRENEHSKDTIKIEGTAKTGSAREQNMREVTARQHFYVSQKQQVQVKEGLHIRGGGEDSDVPMESDSDSEDTKKEQQLKEFLKSEYRNTKKKFEEESWRSQADLLKAKKSVEDNRREIEKLVEAVEHLMKDVEDAKGARGIENLVRDLAEHGTVLRSLALELEAMSSGTYIVDLRVSLEESHGEELISNLEDASPESNIREAHDATNALYQAPRPKTISDLQNFHRSLQALTSTSTQHFGKRQKAYEEFATETQDDFIAHLKAVKKELNIIISGTDGTDEAEAT
jgi:hypothetical protein